MSLVASFKSKQQVAQNTQQAHSAGLRQTLPNLYLLRQMEKIIQQTNKEIELLKNRVSQLEAALAVRGEPVVAACENAEQSGALPSTPPLPITELKQLAEMAKRFK